MKYKKGDKVRVKESLIDGDCEYGIAFDMEKLCNHVVTIESVNSKDNCYRLVEDKGNYKWTDGCFYECIINKSDIKKYDIISLEDGDELIFNGEEFVDLYESNDNTIVYLDDLDYYFEHSKIDKIERPILYTAFNKNKNIKELTLKEVCDLLGYEIKIKKED